MYRPMTSDGISVPGTGDAFECNISHVLSLVIDRPALAVVQCGPQGFYARWHMAQLSSDPQPTVVAITQLTSQIPGATPADPLEDENPFHLD